MSKSVIKILVVDDSPVIRELLAHIFTSDPQLQVVGTATNGLEALEAVKKKHPDVVTMDVNMPRMDGFEATRQIMESQPTPIVIVSGSSSTSEVAFSFQAIEAGALAVVPRPPGLTHPGHAAAARELIQSVKLMSEVRVVTRRVLRKKVAPPPIARPVVPGEIKLVAIGASTGGPPVLQQILSALPKDLPFPLVIVQHIARGFTTGYTEWLAGTSGFPLKIAEHGEYLRPGMGYIAVDGWHLEVEYGPRAFLNDQEPESTLRPSINHLFRSVARSYGDQAVGVLLTGMGSDGSRALLEMRERGAITVVQDEASSVVYGMAGEAVKMGAAEHVLPPEGIALLLAGLVRKNNGGDQ